MATKKAGGSSQNARDSNPKYLGVKVNQGGKVRPGMVIVRQRGRKMIAGKGAKTGGDDTIFSLIEGSVSFRSTRKTAFDGRVTRRTVVDVVA